MAQTGDSSDMLRRLNSLIPRGWFASVAPIRDVVHGGIADSLAWLYSQLQVVKAATRRAGTTGWLLDIDAYGFFGANFLRRPGENDAAWRARYTNEIFRQRVTRAAISDAVSDLVGTAPLIFEPWNPGDCGAYDVGTLAYSGDLPLPTLGGYDSPLGGYDCGTFAYVAPLPPGAVAGYSTGAGCYGDYQPNQIYIQVQRPPSTGMVSAGQAGFGYYDVGTLAYGGGTPGIPVYAGYDSPLAGYDSTAFSYCAPLQQVGEFAGAGSWADAYLDGSIPISDDEIYATVAAVTAAGVVPWTRIVEQLPTPPVTVITAVPGSFTADSSTIDADDADVTADSL